MNIPKFIEKKKRGGKLVVVTAYDYPSAKLADGAGVDAILVGDSLGMVVCGQANTLAVTVDQICYHTEMVVRAAKKTLVIADLPFPEGNLGSERAAATAAEILKRTGCHAIKIEGGADRVETISKCVNAGIPVMGHIGLLPQSIKQIGKYSIQREEQKLINDAVAVEDAGAFSVVLECVESTIAKRISREINIPTIGIGSGKNCDGQVLVWHDLLGLTGGGGYIPKHAKQYANLDAIIADALTQYCDEVRAK